MRILTRPLATAACAALLLAACTEQAEEQPPTETTILEDDVALGDDEVLIHLLERPALPAALDGAVVTEGELRHPELFERHVVQVVDVPAGASVALEEPLVAGAVMRVPADATLTVDADVDVAAVDEAGVVAAPAACTAPCEVAGGSIVSVGGWMTGYAVQGGWQLLVPAPERGAS